MGKRGTTRIVTIPGLGCSRTLVLLAGGFTALSAGSGALVALGGDVGSALLLLLLTVPALLATIGAYRRAASSGTWAIAAGLALALWTLIGQSGTETAAGLMFYLVLAAALVIGGVGLRRDRFASCALVPPTAS